MIPPDPDPGRPPLPSPGGPGRAEDIEATTSYPPPAGSSPVASAPVDRPGGSGRFAFLGPPRGEGELGWLAHYRVLSLIGEGGIGLVFLAEDAQLSRPVALKVIKPGLADAAGVRARFLREAQATAAIKHDHIVTIYQVGRDHDTLFLAMEHLRGVSLQGWLERGRKPSNDLVLRIGREIASGLGAAHRRGLVHRDVKPANIWLEAPSGRVKILDFGMARSERDDVLVTHSGTIMGTPAFMSPEQARGETVGASSDLFSLGCLLYRLCTGRLPFQGETILAVLSALASDTPRSPRSIEPDVLPTLDDLVMRLLAKESASRPVSAQAVVDTIKSIERERIAERQRLELSGIAVSPKDPSEGERPEVGGAEEVVDPGTPARAHGIGRARWIAAAVFVIAAAATLARFAFVPDGPSPPEKLAVAPAPVPVPAPDTQPAGGRVGPERTDDPVPSQTRTGKEPPPRGDERGADPGKKGPPLLVGPILKAQPATDRPENDRSTGESKPTIPNGPPVMMPGDSKPLAGRAELNGPPGKPIRADREPEEWTDIVIPGGDCKIELDRPGKKVKIRVPNTAHILSAELGRMNAPRLLRRVEGDFDARVRVFGVFQPAGKSTVEEYTSPYHGAGILLWQDEKNYVRLEIAAKVRDRKPFPYANFEYRKGGVLAVSDGLEIKDGSSFIRLKRRGETISADFGTDGVRWTAFRPIVVRMEDRLEIGLTAINSATKPLVAQLEGFELLQKPAAAAGRLENLGKP